MAARQQSQKSRRIEAKSLALRQELWPALSKDQVWSRKTFNGWTTVPRVLPLTMHLIGLLHKGGTGDGAKGNPSRVYLDLWLRLNDESYLEVTDESEYAYSAGYTGTRATRTWREHVLKLRELGFILIAPRGNRDIGYIFIVNPYFVAEQKKKANELPDSWWTAFVARVQKTGAHFPSDQQQSDGNAIDFFATS